MSLLLRPRWLALHCLVLAMVATCGVMSYWQFVRAEAGNGRSLGYALQWPGFGLFALGVWIWLCRDAVRSGGRTAERGPAPVSAVRVDDELVLPGFPTRAPDPGLDADPELAAYNAMLTRMSERITR